MGEIVRLGISNLLQISYVRQISIGKIRSAIDAKCIYKTVAGIRVRTIPIIRIFRVFRRIIHDRIVFLDPVLMLAVRRPFALKAHAVFVQHAGLGNRPLSFRLF